MMNQFNTIEGKDYLYSVLLIQNKQLTPEAKYLLIRILWLSRKQLTPISLLVSIERFGLSEAVLRKAYELLLRLGYLEECKPSVEVKEQVGRPKKLVQVTKWGMEKINAEFVKSQIWLSKQCGAHKQRIDLLLLWDETKDVLRQQNQKKIKKDNDDKARRYTFTAATRILLAILYLHADRHGVVKDLSLGDFSKLTGMLSDRLESQFIIITGLGYLLSRVAGLTNKGLFGQVKSVFYLNVYNDNLLASKDKPVFFAVVMLNNDYNKFSWAYRIKLWLISSGKIFPYLFPKSDNEFNAYIRGVYNNISNLKKQFPISDNANLAEDLPLLLVCIRKIFEFNGLYFECGYPGFKGKNLCLEDTRIEHVFQWQCLFHPFKIEELFSGGLTTDFFKYLQFKIDEYACELLNEVFKPQKDNEAYWHQHVYMHQAVLTKILADFFPAINNHAAIVNDTKKSAFQLLIYCIAYQHALAMQSLFKCMFPSMIDNDYSLSILPVNNLHYCTSARYQIFSIYSKSRLCDESFIAKQYSTRDSKFIGIENDEFTESFMKIIGYDFKKLVSLFGN